MNQLPPNNISKEKEQEILLSIVETWNPSQTPEYRGFKCANCQKFKNEAWYHWVNTGGYRLPIHMCNDTCEPAFRAGQIKIDDSRRNIVDRNKFGLPYPEKAVERFKEIVSSWPEYEDPQLKEFTCDNCSKVLTLEELPDGSLQRQGYHVWWKMPDNKTLAEFHFHKNCGDNLEINKVGNV